MRYDAAQVDYLAAEYVLGTLRGPARRRFDRLITERADIQFAVWRWERHLSELAIGLKPLKPPLRVWKNIRRRVESSRQRKTTFPGAWRGLWLAVPTAFVAAWLAIALLPVPAADRLAVFADQNAQTLWVVSADLDRGLLSTQAVTVPASEDNTSYELWILRAEAPPLSLGLLPIAAGSVEIRLSASLLAALTDADRLAISLEPAGGSPTGLPTGPVVYVASLIAI